MRSVALIVVCACGSAASSAPGAAELAEPRRPAPREAGPLGMNDVSILLPLPRDPRVPVLAAIATDGAPLVGRDWFDALVTEHHDIGPKVGEPPVFEDFQVVAVRFDLCDRSTAGPCPDGVAGRLRLVLQPCYTTGGATLTHDIALHAFYPVAPEALAAMVGELRALARIQGAPPDAPLEVSPAAAAGDARYLARLRALVMRHARPSELVRLTLIGQQAGSAAFAWRFRGLDRSGEGFVPLEIPGVAATQQSTLLAGGDTVYTTEPVADVPAGFALATNGARFAAAAPDERAAALAALVALQNPLRHDTGDTQCLGCHVATYLTARRAAATGIDPAAIAERFSSSHNLAVATVAGRDPRVVRGFGWAGDAPAISQRVANDTAEVLSEIDARYPAR
jgi:hypothetical protein